MAPNPVLKEAIFRSGRSQIDIAQEAGIHETKFSKIVRGWRVPRPDEQKRIAKALRLPVKHLFPAEDLVERGA